MDVLIDHHLYLWSFCRTEAQYKVVLLSQTRPERALDKIGFSTGWNEKICSLVLSPDITIKLTGHYTNGQHVFSLKKSNKKIASSLFCPGRQVRVGGFFL